MIRSVTVMGTIVTIHLVADDEPAMSRAFEWFRQIEACCTRFDPASELMQLTARVGVAVPASEMLYEAVQFALAVADDTAGAFDPTVGHEMERRGFNRDDRSGGIVRTDLAADTAATYRDVELNPDGKTITLRRPLILDLGAVAKGMAIDMAARELQPFENFAIDAGGDLFLGGCNPEGLPWFVGIRHPRLDGELIDAIRVSNASVCTSGDYERKSTGADGGHILDPRAGVPASGVVSATVVAPTAMLADALSTAAFTLGPHDGIRLLERHGVEGLIVSPELECHTTPGFAGMRH